MRDNQIIDNPIKSYYLILGNNMGMSDYLIIGLFV
jgi:hypothetical protein